MSLLTLAPGETSVARIVTIVRQIVQYLNAGGGGPIRIVLTSATTFNVATTGSDTTGNGSVALPWRHIQFAIDTVVRSFDFNLQQVFINVAPGNYPENIVVKTYIGGNTSFGYAQLVVQATDPVPANTKINPTSGVAIFGQNNVQSPYVFKGFQLESPGNPVILCQCDSGGTVAFDGCFFGRTTNFGCLSQYQSRIIFINRDFSILGNSDGSGCSVFSSSNNKGQIFIQPGHTITLVNTPAWQFYFAQCVSNSEQNWISTTFVGAATGTRFYCDTGGGLQTGGGGPNFFPGNAAGTLIAPGWYQ